MLYTLSGVKKRKEKEYRMRTRRSAATLLTVMLVTAMYSCTRTEIDTQNTCTHAHILHMDAKIQKKNFLSSKFVFFMCKTSTKRFLKLKIVLFDILISGFWHFVA